MYNNPEIIETGDIEQLTAMSYTPASTDGPALLTLTFALNGQRPYADPPTAFLWPAMPPTIVRPQPLEAPVEEAAPEPSAPDSENTVQADTQAATASAPAAAPPAPPPAPTVVPVGNGKKGNSATSAASTPTEG